MSASFLSFSVIIPARRQKEATEVLDSIWSSWPDNGPSIEVLIATGENPSRQRNQAMEQACGHYLIFLDNDCQVDASFWKHLLFLCKNLEFDICGGPLLLPPGASWLESLFQAVLSHPWIVGPLAARYAAKGVRRRASQQSLILANLVVRAAWARPRGGFDERLYPNEENEWLDRATEAQAVIYYDPDLVVYRPQRQSLTSFLFMLLRYGAGRTRQFFVSKRGSWNQCLLGVALLWFGLLFFFPGVALLLGGLGGIIYFFVLLFLISFSDKEGLNSWLLAALGLGVVITYSLGQGLGLLGWPWRKYQKEKVTIFATTSREKKPS